MLTCSRDLHRLALMRPRPAASPPRRSTTRSSPPLGSDPASFREAERTLSATWCAFHLTRSASSTPLHSPALLSRSPPPSPVPLRTSHPLTPARLPPPPFNQIEAVRTRARRAVLAGSAQPFPSLVISADSLVPQGAFAELQATYLKPDMAKARSQRPPGPPDRLPYPFLTTRSKRLPPSPLASPTAHATAAARIASHNIISRRIASRRLSASRTSSKRRSWA